MNTAQDAVTAVQAQALEAIKSGQNAAVEAVQAWSQAVVKLTPEVPGLSQVPGLPEVPGVKDTVGDPVAIVDSVYDFATQLLTLNKEFAHSLLEASQSSQTVAKAPKKA